MFTPLTRMRQNCPVLSSPCRWCERNWRQDKTVLSRLDPLSNLQLFSLKYTEDCWKLGNWKVGWDKTKLSCLVCSCVHTADTDKTRQSCLVRVSGVNRLLVVSCICSFCCVGFWVVTCLSLDASVKWRPGFAPVKWLPGKIISDITCNVSDPMFNHTETNWLSYWILRGIRLLSSNVSVFWSVWMPRVLSSCELHALPFPTWAWGLQTRSSRAQRYL